MKQFEVTITAQSRKTFLVKAANQDEALNLADAIVESTNLLDFTDADVESMEITCDEQYGGMACCGSMAKSEDDCTPLSVG